jgi:regulator of sirC expression with transglutaminase-like and TPR domain
LDLDPKLGKAHLALVNLYLRQKRNTEAVAELQAFLKLLPDDPLAPKVREVLKRLQSNSGEAKQ